MIRYCTLLALSWLLSGCGTLKTAEPAISTQIVDRPLAASCVPDNLEAAPTYPDTNEALKAAPDAATRYQLVIVGRGQRQARLDQVEPAIAGCRKAAWDDQSKVK